MFNLKKAGKAKEIFNKELFSEDIYTDNFKLFEFWEQIVFPKYRAIARNKYHMIL